MYGLRGLFKTVTGCASTGYVACSRRSPAAHVRATWPVQDGHRLRMCGLRGLFKTVTGCACAGYMARSRRSPATHVRATWPVQDGHRLRMYRLCGLFKEVTGSVMPVLPPAATPHVS